MPSDSSLSSRRRASEARFQCAGVHARQAGWLAVGSCAIGLLFAALALASIPAPALWRTAAASLATAFLLLGSGLVDAFLVARGRNRLLDPPHPPPPLVAGGRLGRLRQLRRRIGTHLRGVPREFVGALLTAFPLIPVAGVLAVTWSAATVPDAASRWDPACGGAALLLAFAMLVLERHFSAVAPVDWPEAPGLALFGRSALLVCLVVAAAGMMVPAEGAWRFRIVRWMALLPAAAGAELALRLLASLFVRHDPRDEPRTAAGSVVLQILRWPPRRLTDLQDELRSRFGIDLRQNWAFGYMRRSALPVLGSILAIAWLLSGVREVAAGDRAIHERFGRPEAVWQSGLHIGLPWPFSRTRTVDNGTVRTVAIATADEPPPPDLSTADGPPPESANRLWDASHVSEKSQVIARRAADRESFEIVNMDVRFVYRIGLSDEAALAATYQAADLTTLIRSAAGRVLVEDFATRTLDAVIGARREAMAREVGGRVQRELDAVHSGVEILATLIESVHPPAAAANAYHSVQAAQIRTQAAIAREHGRAAEESNEAALQASMTHDKAAAAAREALAAAEAATLRFNAERDAHHSAGQAFLLERYLGQLVQGLSGTRLVLLDHRVGGGATGPVLDLRDFAPAGAAATP